MLRLPLKEMQASSGTVKGMFKSNAPLVWRLLILLQFLPGVLSWGKEGHYATCKIAEGLLTQEAITAVKMLLPDYANGELASLCSWADEIRHNPRWRWTGPLHYIDTPDFKCNYDYCRKHPDETAMILPEGKIDVLLGQSTTIPHSCHIMGFPLRNRNVRQISSDKWLSVPTKHGSVPLHVGFTGDAGGNTIAVRWYRRKTNLHHVWDNMIIESAVKKFCNLNLEVLVETLQTNILEDWSADIPSWEVCESNQTVCPNLHASESICLACKFAYRNATPGSTLGDEYFHTRLPIVEKRLAQGGVRLAAVLNHIFQEVNSMGRFLFFQAVICLMVLYAVPVAQSWGKEGHILTCRIAQELFQPEAAEAVKNLLQDSVNGDLSALCSWPDEVRHLPHYQRMSSLHFVNTPDEACTFDYSRDCKRDECVVGAISEFTSQLLHYNEEPADPQYNMTEALLFLSHFIGDIHQA
ncbi:S1/P1 Nuclease [Musa troglodytarum]|uniref:Aspergillus nuclease S1 n=2 Tax=Musa troglodytarum TaxID=320322 RepID=A0A9E7H8R5_9LILI|nr:S1/P1 Nuclease [Musa troglodytarum]